MLFNSYPFILAFLPVTVAGFFVLGRFSRPSALGWLILASLFFYAWWRPLNVLIIAPSIAVNFIVARMLLRLGGRGRTSLARTLLLAGIAFNVAFLGYFKYANFAVTAAHDLFGAGMTIEHIVLPLGISFITFQKIAFLIDVHAGRVESFTLRDYALFVLFFPQLIAGPIVHYREMMPQFHRAPCRFEVDNVAVGLTLFVFGLFKKAVLADGIAPFVNAIFGQAAAGAPVTFMAAWMAAVGFTLQIYFDFSGYTDMALGIARFFGIKLPPNFNSPLKATSIVDFWLRWHMTLTRFLTAYIYNPLALALTRRRLARGRPGLGVRQTTVSGFVYLLAFPTLLTMLVSGIWHGAGYLFILWGLMHGAYLTINHAWRTLAQATWPDRERYRRIMRPVGFVLTFGCVVVSMVVFRSTSLTAASGLFHGMLGLSGMAPAVSLHGLAIDAMHSLRHLAAAPVAGDDVDWGGMAFRIGVLAMIALAGPNTLELLGRCEPALGWRQGPASAGRLARALEWSASPAWALVVSALAVAGILYLGGQSEFLYWQF